jgi:RNA polymerase sigma-54 factor
MLEQRLQQKLLQKLSPQQIQLIKLLEIPTMQLEQRIKKEIEENPVLEEGITQNDESLNDQAESEEKLEESGKNEVSFEEIFKDDDQTPAYKLATRNYSKDDEHRDIPFSVGATFYELLEEQLGLQTISDHERAIAKYVLGSIDEDGYLRRDIEALVDDLAFTQNISTSFEEVLRILSIIQEMEPAGVGARDLQECLLLQIRQADQSRPEVKIASRILKNHFEEFSKKHYDKIIRQLNISEDELRDAIEEIIHLNPKPGSSFQDKRSQINFYVVPDFILEEEDSELILSLNQKNVPDLRISRTYTQMLETLARNKGGSKVSEKEAVVYVKQKMDSAKWFIDALKQRENTLLSTMREILDYQREFFLTGDETRLRPMILKDIAERTNLDISTISRVANSKYIQTPYGVYALKYFFSEGMQTESGEEVSTREVKIILQECISRESKKAPLTDDQLAKILHEKGYIIARRTVAKYREQLDIPVARMRKEV